MVHLKDTDTRHHLLLQRPQAIKGAMELIYLYSCVIVLT
jgi:hypothetical protein